MRTWTVHYEPGTTETTPDTETPRPEPTGEWSEWSAWSVCSAGCGDGEKTRFRTCSNDDCEGSPTESMACNQGDCLGCKVNWGDFGQHFHKGCNNDLFFGDGALYMPPKTQCAEVTCGMTTGLLQCSCNTKGKCKMKLDGEILRQSFRQN